MTTSPPFLFAFSSAALGMAAIAAPHSAAAQEIVQPVPEAASAQLAAAERRLARNPDSIPALLEAGRAALALGEVDAALRFFNRAQARRPDDGRVLAGLALVAVRRGEGLAAVQLFQNAHDQGTSVTAHAGDRGLAYDLIGNNVRAQQYYRQALSRQPSDEVIRRLALSYAMSGDAAASEATLLPLLQRQDRRAYRTRAFALAILGRDQEAITIAETMLPARFASRLAPYLRYMPSLTTGQQAAAANLGRFPPASRMGREPAVVAAAPAPAPPPARPVPANDRLTPTGEPLGRPASTGGELPATGSATTLPTVATREISAPLPAAAAPAQPDAATVVTLDDAAAFPPAEEARPSFSITEAEPASQEQVDLASAFADFTLPAEGMDVPRSADAVDITAITPAREAEPDAAPPPPANPSRHWVQVATGQDIAAFRFDWRRIVRNSDGLLEGRDPFTTPWNQTNRLLTGPFDSRSAAQQFVTELAGAGVDAFRFTSAEGEEVRPVD
ncbi:tetratricopeptide repeat protein [Aurantiacibacter aquimixticola]|nr:SPOR domain-containing protein [Aurantiacibacter aquimixticola]